MTKLHIVSDIHLEFADWDLPDTDADAVVLAGDIGTGVQGIEWAKRFATWNKPIFFVPGNHDFYHMSWPSHRTALKAAAVDTPVIVLDCDRFNFKDITLVGTTLWSDFCLFGLGTEAHHRWLAERNMHDYDTIKRDGGHWLSPSDTQRDHTLSRRWLTTQLESIPTDRKVVVVTHHAPSERMLSPHFRERMDVLNPAYASNLEPLINPPVNLWVSGHTHYSTMQMINDIPVVANCRGYPNDISPTDPYFIPDLVIDV